MNTSPNETEARQKLRQWIEGNARRPVPGGLRDDTPIIEQRVITSLQLMELILFIEKTAARQVDIARLRPSSFRSIDDICTNFFDESRRDEQPAA